jgi:hypothetical protein
MEIFTIIASIIISFPSSAGLLLDKIVADVIKSNAKNVEQLEVRVSNLPIHQIINGQVKKIRIASRGLKPMEGVRIETLEIETDSLDIDLNNLEVSNFNDLRQSLRKPLQGGINLVFTEQDLNKTLQSAQIQSYLPKIIGNSNNSNFQIINPRLNLLANNRIEIETQIKLLNRGQEDILDTTLEFGIEVIKGSKINIIEPIGTLNGRKLSKKLLQGFADNFNGQLDFHRLEASGITLRFLQFNINDHKIKMAAFVRIKDNNSN